METFPIYVPLKILRVQPRSQDHTELYGKARSCVYSNTCDLACTRPSIYHELDFTSGKYYPIPDMLTRFNSGSLLCQIDSHDIQS